MRHMGGRTAEIRPIDPDVAADPTKTTRRIRPIEWPTWICLIAVHVGWGGVLLLYPILGAWIILPGVVIVAFHSSLQHEILHGHPTRYPVVNELLVSLPLGLLIPYRRFKALHLRHHNDSRLTDPYDDPETWYLAERDWDQISPLFRPLLWANGTLAGRVVIGPWLMIWGFLRADFRHLGQGCAEVRGAWFRHLPGVVGVLTLVHLSGMPVWLYVLGMGVPALSLLSVRTFIEHRAASHPAGRSVVLEAGLFWRLLFLNNNLHRVHHEAPSLPWYDLPTRWQAERDRILRENGGYFIPGYGAVARRWLFSRREPMVHPLMRKTIAAEQDRQVP